MKTITLVSALCLLALAEAVGADTTSTAKGFISKTVTVDGKEVRYAVYVPWNYDPAKPMPTILYLHGADDSGTDGLKQLASGLAPAIMRSPEKWPFVVVFPQKPDPNVGWSKAENVAMAALNATIRELNVDQTRIYITGFSSGGHGTWSVTAHHPDTFAAAAPMCGLATKEVVEGLAHVPVWAFHNEDDHMHPVATARQMAEWLNLAGGSCKLTVYPTGGHNCWDRAYSTEDLGKWFLQHHRPSTESLSTVLQDK